MDDDGKKGAHLKHLSDVMDKKVYDVNKKELGVAKDFEVSLSDSQVYLRVEGEPLKDLRNHMVEFFPMNEIDDMGESITMYKTLEELRDSVEHISMSNTPSYKATDLLGMHVTSETRMLGKVVDFSVDKQANMIKIVVEGDVIREVKGEDREAIPVDEIREISEKVVIQHDLDTLIKRLRESKDV